MPDNILVIDPVSYMDMLDLEKNARIIVTDSGGIQKEAYWFNVPCVTMTEEDEWVEMSRSGCNRIVGSSKQAILEAILSYEIAYEAVAYPPGLYGNGDASGKIANIVEEECR
jgi:UDP-N-acetylglucosamine 2-epimerase